jgi:DNA-binding response OmpR family regulator
MTKNEILAVEDDERISASMKLALEDEGYIVSTISTAEEALDCFANKSFDLVLIDLMLPGMDGFQLCRTIRNRSGVPIIIVTARSDSHDVVGGLEAGADDYVTKPFVVKELAARIRALLRRAQTSDDSLEIVRIGDIEVRVAEGVVTREGKPIHLTRTEFRLLCELSASPNHIFSREQLLERVWSYDYFGDGRLVDVHIRRLRTKIETDPANPQLLITMRGLGYKLVL